MSRKHYIALAARIKASRKPKDQKYATAKLIAEACAADNPRFKPEVFFKACGL